jgi:DNA-binding MarR family transcriptional regulator
MSEATKKRTLHYLGQCERAGLPPTVREIEEYLGIRGRTETVALLDDMEEEGLITRHPKKARSIRLVQAGNGNGSAPSIASSQIEINRLNRELTKAQEQIKKLRKQNVELMMTNRRLNGLLVDADAI